LKARDEEPFESPCADAVVDALHCSMLRIEEADQATGKLLATPNGARG
jgi:hypothetical protein